MHGWGSESALFAENAAGKPDKPATVVTTVEGTSIKVDWETPTSNYKTITAYKVTIKDKGTGIYVEDTSLCDGSDTGTLANTHCLIPIISLRLGHSDYDYELGDTP